MTRRLIHWTTLSIIVLGVSIAVAQAQTANSQTNDTASRASAKSEFQFSSLLAPARRRRRSDFSPIPSSGARASASLFNIMPMVAGPTLPVVGGGTLGRLTKWTGFTSSTSFIGDTTIFEDKYGLVGIGTDTPTSKLTIAGTIEMTVGGLKFPDGTFQTTAGLASVFHDASLMGSGTSGSALGIAPGGVQSVHLANGAVTAAKIANGAVVRSLNGLFDNVNLAAGSNITITPGGNTLTIAAAGALSGVAHDMTLQGNGTSGSPLGVAVPLNLTGAVAPNGSSFDSVIKATNTAEFGTGVVAIGGNSNSNEGGDGVFAFGGDSNSDIGGVGVVANGGMGDFAGGIGVRGLGGGMVLGGRSIHHGGIGVAAEGGNGDVTGGAGVTAFGGFSDGDGGDAVESFGGDGNGAGHHGGAGISAKGGRGNLGATRGLAGNFIGDVNVSGSLSKGAGSFKIDHPLDPENKYLYHSFVESPDMMNIYNGVTKLDSNGEAAVELPEWFGALNRDFRYLLTAIGTSAPNLYIAEEISTNRFKIAGGTPGMKVSWQVTGIRQDGYANKHRIPVEEDKPERERGYYLHPDVFNQPEERGIEWTRDTDTMQQHKRGGLKQNRN